MPVLGAVFDFMEKSAVVLEPQSLEIDRKEITSIFPFDTLENPFRVRGMELAFFLILLLISFCLGIIVNNLYRIIDLLQDLKSGQDGIDSFNEEGQ